MVCFWHATVRLTNFAELFPHLLLFVGTEVALSCNKRQSSSRTSELSNKTVKEMEGAGRGGVQPASLEISEG